MATPSSQKETPNICKQCMRGKRAYYIQRVLSTSIHSASWSARVPISMHQGPNWSRQYQCWHWSWKIQSIKLWRPKVVTLKIEYLFSLLGHHFWWLVLQKPSLTFKGTPCRYSFLIVFISKRRPRSSSLFRKFTTSRGNVSPITLMLHSTHWMLVLSATTFTRTHW